MSTFYLHILTDKKMKDVKSRYFALTDLKAG